MRSMEWMPFVFRRATPYLVDAQRYDPSTVSILYKMADRLLCYAMYRIILRSILGGVCTTGLIGGVIFFSIPKIHNLPLTFRLLKSQGSLSAAAFLFWCVKTKTKTTTKTYHGTRIEL